VHRQSFSHIKISVMDRSRTNNFTELGQRWHDPLPRADLKKRITLLHHPPNDSDE
jgi:hypothetical protein